MAKNSGTLLLIVLILLLISLFKVAVTDDGDDQFHGAKSKIWQPLASAKTTSFEYWMNWRVLLCALILTSTVLVDAILIWKYEVSRGEDLLSGSSGRENTIYEDEAWKPCLKQIHPLWLLTYRISAVSVLLLLFFFSIVKNGVATLYYYTQWTSLLVILYFMIGSVLSIHGYHGFLKKTNYAQVLPMEEEHGETSTSKDPTRNTIKILQEHITQDEVLQQSRVGGIWICLFQIIYQTTAGAVMLTDGVFWLIIFPFLVTDDFNCKNNLLMIAVHSVNLLYLLGEAAMNSLRFWWFRILYVGLWTSIFVLFQWILHACISTWWAYPFLDPLTPYSPIWYLIIGLMHIPCYTVFFLLIKMKHFLLPKWFPRSHNLCLTRKTSSMLPLRGVIVRLEAFSKIDR